MGKFHQQKTFITAISVFLIAFIAAFFANSVFAPSNTTNADTMVFEIEGTDYSTTVSSADIVEINVQATPTGTVAIGSDTITTVTNNPEGYKLYFAMDQMADYDETHPGNALYQDGNSTSGHFISPTTGTISAPDTLSENTWGFALVGGENRQTGVPDTFAAFDPVYVDSNGNSSTGETGKKMNSDSKFAEVPLYPNAVLVQESDTATSDEGNKLSVYYGVNGSMSLPNGHYMGSVSYFVLPEGSAQLTDLISIDPTTLDSSGGQDVLIATSLHTNYQFENDQIEVTLTNKDDSSITGTCAVTSTSVESGSLIFHCDSPSVAVGTYTVKVEIPLYGKTWEKDVEVVEIKKNFWTITTMQEMTSEICNSVYTPSNATGANVTLISDRETYENTVTEDGQPYVAQRILYDIRDDKGYTVRKLADGNCWMTSNLQLELNSTTTYKDYGSYNDGTTFDLTPGDSTLPTWSSCGSNGACAFNTNTPATGGFYSWYAATAGKGRSTDSAGTDIDGSICPKGWKLPYNYTVDNVKSYSGLLSAYGMPTTNVDASYVATLEAVPLSFSRAGYYLSGGLIYAGTGGDYWSSTVSGSATAYGFSYYTSHAYPQYSDGMYYGFSVRCLAL